MRIVKRAVAAAVLLLAVLGPATAASADSVCVSYWTTMPTEIRLNLPCIRVA